MIPRRSGGLMGTIPTGNGELPPLPPDAGVAPQALAQVSTPVVAESSSREALFSSLAQFSQARKNDSVSKQAFDLLKAKELIVVVGDWAVVSKKGLNYLVDFNVLQ